MDMLPWASSLVYGRERRLTDQPSQRAGGPLASWQKGAITSGLST
jgi:hypothetical protein